MPAQFFLRVVALCLMRQAFPADNDVVSRLAPVQVLPPAHDLPG